MAPKQSFQILATFQSHLILTQINYTLMAGEGFKVLHKFHELNISPYYNDHQPTSSYLLVVRWSKTMEVSSLLGWTTLFIRLCNHQLCTGHSSGRLWRIQIARWWFHVGAILQVNKLHLTEIDKGLNCIIFNRWDG